MEFDDIFSGLQSNSESSKNAAANALFNQIMTRGMRHLMRKWRFPEQDAEEVMMTSMEKMFLKINSVKDSKAFKSWCWTVIENSAHDFYKARKIKHLLQKKVHNNRTFQSLMISMQYQKLLTIVD